MNFCNMCVCVCIYIYMVTLLHNRTLPIAYKEDKDASLDFVVLFFHLWFHFITKCGGSSWAGRHPLSSPTVPRSQ